MRERRLPDAVGLRAREFERFRFGRIGEPDRGLGLGRAEHARDGAGAQYDGGEENGAHGAARGWSVASVRGFRVKLRSALLNVSDRVEGGAQSLPPLAVVFPAFLFRR